MSNTDKLVPLTPRRDSGQFIVWRLVKPHANESCRWEALDGRWISLSLGHDEDIGSIVLCNSEGKRELIESYEGALELAKEWRQ